ncbi:unnamed protein product [Paramecium pentaurelia]|uniref:non-specific serine/threonine protein kinase n=1 Tax=Paramecium pentaurelia TaxID=43138 RepID=A0A8S1YD98_9CILI|nr:unnamed protein product [Paramecium pentaurelia]
MKQKNKKPISELLKQKRIAEQQSQLPQQPSSPPSRSSSSSSSKTSDPYEDSSDAEDYEDYKKDGYHPVSIGDKFHNGRFQVIQKLGWGHFSTVWLAHDKQSETHVALKIQKSKQSYQESAIDELELLKDLQKHLKDEKWIQYQEQLSQIPKLDYKTLKWGDPNIKNTEQDMDIKVKLNETYCVEMVDNFIHYGMHGKHYCTVFEVLGPSLLDLIIHFDDYDKRMGMWLVKQITRELLIGLVYMHEVCNIIHTDLKPENIMLQLKPSNFGEFVEQMKMVKKKPISMKFLDKLKKSMKTTNKKQEKRKKQKQKKLQQQQEKDQQVQIEQQQQQKDIQQQDIQQQQKDTQQQQQQQEQQQQQQQQDIQKQLSTNNNDIKEHIQEDLSIEQKNTLVNVEQNSTNITSVQHTVQLEPITDDESEQISNVDTIQNQVEQQTNPEKENQELLQKEEVHHIHKHRNLQKEKEKALKDKKKSHSGEEDISSDEEDQDWKSDDQSDESESNEVDEETLYTLKWKEHIKIKLDRDLSIKIVDFGNACWTHKHFTDNIQTREYRAPEAILGIEYDTSTDIWSTACIVFELITNDYLFKPRKGKGFKKSEDHLAQMMEVLGKMNKKWALSGSNSREFFNKTGQLINIKDLHPTSISKILMSDYGFSYSDANQIEDFLVPMLAFEPKKRITARQALQHPWLWSK